MHRIPSLTCSEPRLCGQTLLFIVIANCAIRFSDVRALMAFFVTPVSSRLLFLSLCWALCLDGYDLLTCFAKQQYDLLTVLPSRRRSACTVVRRRNFVAYVPKYTRMVWPRITKFGMVTELRRGIFLGVSHVPVPRGKAPTSPNFLGPLTTPKWFDLDPQKMEC